MEHKRLSGSEVFVHQLIEYVNRENLQVGDRLPSVRDLSRILNMSTSVVRDGLLHAQTVGLIKIIPRAGAFLQSVNYDRFVNVLIETLGTALFQSDHHLIDLNDARCLIETRTMEMAAVRHRPEDMLSLHNALSEMKQCGDDRVAFVLADEEFHMRIARIAGNELLGVMLKAVLALLRPHRVREIVNADNRKRAECVHSEIYNLIREGNGPGASAKIFEHLDFRRTEIIAEVENSP